MARKRPRLSVTERKRRARVAKARLLPKAIAAVGRRGFRATVAKLRGKPGIRSPEKLAGWLKGEAKRRGVLSPEHPYVGRRKRRVRRRKKKIVRKKRRTIPAGAIRRDGWILPKSREELARLRRGRKTKAYVTKKLLES